MRILGIDPGYAIVGYGVLDYDNNKFKTIEYGAITTPSSMNMFDRLKSIMMTCVMSSNKQDPNIWQ